MSHFTRVRTRLAHRESILRALDDLDMKWDDERPRGYNGATTSAEFRIRGAGSYDIGFVPGPDGYEMVADWYEMGIDSKRFTERLTQRYAYHTTRTRLEEQGFELVEEQTREDGRLHLVMRRMG